MSNHIQVTAAPAPLPEAQALTSLSVQLRTGQEHALEIWLRQVEQENRHPFPGTVARLIACGQTDPTRVQILLLWEKEEQLSSPECQAALAALRADLASLVNWQTERSDDLTIVLHPPVQAGGVLLL